MRSFEITDDTEDDAGSAPDRRAIRADAQPGDGTPGNAPSPGATAAPFSRRLGELERELRWTRVVVVALCVIAVHRMFDGAAAAPAARVSHDAVHLHDASGATRAVLRMYSGVPVLQMLDEDGGARLTLGLRFDGTPFLDLADGAGKTRAAIEVGAEGTPRLRFLSADGQAVTRIGG